MSRESPLAQMFRLLASAASFTQKRQGKEFFNRDASLEIDRLTVKNETLEAENADLRRKLAGPK